MSQFKFNVANAQYPLDAFFTVTVASTAGYLVGEQVAAGAVTADVSRIVDSTRLVVDGLRGGITMSGNLVGAVSTTTSAISAFASGQPKMRDVGGSLVEKMIGVWSIDDRGFLTKSREDTHYEVGVAARLGLSKIQNTDTSVVPTLAYGLPADGTYADGATLRFTINSNEALSVVGAPRVAILNAGSAVTTYAVYKPEFSDSMNLVFEYVNEETESAAGQIVSALYDANGAVITDIGGAAVTPTTFGDVTGIILA